MIGLTKNPLHDGLASIPRRKDVRQELSASTAVLGELHPHRHLR